MSYPIEPDEDIAYVRKERDELRARCEAVEKELELERLRLAACGVIALANTRESAIEARSGIAPDYWSGSLQDVICAVDREMDYRERCEAGAKVAAAAVVAPGLKGES